MFTELVSQDSSPETEEDAEETHEILKGRVRTSADEEAHATHSEEVAMSEEEELKHEQEAAEEKVSDRSPHLVSDTSAPLPNHTPQQGGGDVRRGGAQARARGGGREAEGD
jgi:hypothetical protein